MSPQAHSAVTAKSAAMKSFEAQWFARQADPIAPLREQAMERFLKLGLPTMREESWRYTDLRALTARSFIDAPRVAEGDLEPTASLSLLGVTERAATVMIINGYPVIPTTAMDLSVNGIEISTLRDLARMDSNLLTRHLEPLSDAEETRFGLLNTALFIDGLYLKVKTQAATPLVILHVATADAAGEISYPRVIIEATPGSRATIIEHHVCQGAETPLCNSATHIEIQEGAELEHYRVFATGAKTTHIDTLDAVQEKDSRLKQFTIVLGGGLVRASLSAHLAEPGASLDSYSLLVGHEERRVDCVNIAQHSAVNTRSRQTARAIASGTSRVVFNSKVVVEAGAVRSESQQSSRGLLLSPTAEIDSRPQLEIRTDEVKCAHGATTGRLDRDMLFYMLSRGIDRETAQSLLVFAFLADVLTSMSVSSARAAIENALVAQLPDSQILQKFR